MRIVLLGDFPEDPNRIVGGPQAVLTYLVRGFQDQAAVNLDVVTLSPSSSADRRERYAGATIHYLAQPRLPVELLFPWLRRRVHQVIRDLDPDIVHAHNARLFSWLAVTSGYPSVVVAHGIHGTVHQYKSEPVSRARHAIRDWILLRHFSTQVEHLICISPYIQAGYTGRTRARMYAIENPIDDAFFDVVEDRSVPGRVLFAGLLIPRKNPKLLIEAARSVLPRVPALSLNLAGSEKDRAYCRHLRASIANTAIEPHIRFLGHLDERDILREFQEATVVVLPSDQETSPMVIQQAMAAGKPVIATRTGGTEYLVSDGETGYLVERGDRHALADRLSRILTDPELARRLGMNGKVQAERRFRANIVARQTADLYRGILAESSPRIDSMVDQLARASSSGSRRVSGGS